MILSSSSIKAIQQALGLTNTGIWDLPTIAAFKNFQMRIPSLSPTGLADETSVHEFIKRTNLKIDENSPVIEEDVDNDFDVTTDLCEFQIKNHLLPSKEYCNSNAKYEYIFIHHTSGWNNPESTINDWASDARGQIGTQYVIGGTSIKNNTEHDGKILKCIPDPFWAYHLGSTSKDGISSYMHKNSIGIELCNFGWLTGRNGKYYTYTNQEVHNTQVTVLETPFRGYTYWHSYSPLQLEALRYLLIFLGTKYNINLKNGLHQWISEGNDAFKHRIDAATGKIKGVLSHTNVRKDKTDVYPHPELIKLIKSL